jgi:4-hydroxy-tetrahydrodipicolinate synthase
VLFELPCKRRKDVSLLSPAAHEAGADGVMVVVPYYNRPSQEGLYHHYKTVAQQSALPVVIYNIPVRTGSDLNTATLARLAEIKQIVGIKEATGNVLRSQEIAATFGERFTILSGDDALTLAVMAVGGHGVISTTSNLAPKPVAHVVDRFRAGDLAGARALQQKLLPLYRAMFVEGNPGPVKAALAMRGKIAPELRLPMVWPAEASLEQIRRAIDETEVEL